MLINGLVGLITNWYILITSLRKTWLICKYHYDKRFINIRGNLFRNNNFINIGINNKYVIFISWIVFITYFYFRDYR